jgi:hypothetical protein
MPDLQGSFRKPVGKALQSLDMPYIITKPRMANRFAEQFPGKVSTDMSEFRPQRLRTSD